MTTALAGVLVFMGACAPPHGSEEPGKVPTDGAHEPAELPAELSRAGVAPDPNLLLPPLDGYDTDDDAEPGELESSLDHGSVPYVEVRRRLVLDEQGFTSGEVTVVTVPPGSDGIARYLAHRYGDAGGRAVRLAGVEMLRIDAEPHPALAWSGPAFAVTFERGQERSDAWLEDLARATVAAVVEQGAGSS